MFDVGFWEISLIMVVALLVIGPERLPRVARTMGVWVGRARRMVADVKSEVDRELRAEELKRTLGANALDDLRKAAGEVRAFGEELRADVGTAPDTSVAPAATQTRLDAPSPAGAEAVPTQRTEDETSTDRSRDS